MTTSCYPYCLGCSVFKETQFEVKDEEKKWLLKLAEALAMTFLRYNCFTEFCSWEWNKLNQAICEWTFEFAGFFKGFLISWKGPLSVGKKTWVSKWWNNKHEHFWGDLPQSSHLRLIYTGRFNWNLTAERCGFKPANVLNLVLKQLGWEISKIRKFSI